MPMTSLSAAINRAMADLEVAIAAARNIPLAQLRADLMAKGHVVSQELDHAE